MDAFIQYIITERHGIDNIVILVPTRALINQVTARLKKTITNKNYKVLAHPVVPMIYRNRMLKYVFVFTPERLISYLGEKENPVINYMFVDEAHKIIAEKDSRIVKKYAALRAKGDATLSERMEMLIQHRQSLNEQIRQLQEHAAVLGEKIAFYQQEIESHQEDAP